MKYVQRFEQNKLGNDFAVGDIHGHYDELMTQLDKLAFNFETDRLFCVGDLVDRGTQSREVVELLNKPWFFSVRGNHDQMIIDQFNDERALLFGMYSEHSPAAAHHLNDGEWFTALSNDKKLWFHNALKTLPYAIEVEVLDGIVGICHAGVPENFKSWNEFTSNLIDRDTRERCLRTRSAPKIKNRGLPDALGTIHGHTTFENIHKVENSFWIDTFVKSGQFTFTKIT